MKKFKIVLWAIIIGLLLVFIFQNQEYFQSKHRLGINFMVINAFTFPEVSNAVIFLLCFLVGGLITYFISLLERFRSKKVFKELNNTIKSHREVISSLKGELEAGKISSVEEKSKKNGTVEKSAGA